MCVRGGGQTAKGIRHSNQLTVAGYASREQCKVDELFVQIIREAAGAALFTMVALIACTAFVITPKGKRRAPEPFTGARDDAILLGQFPTTRGRVID